jgi:3-oxoacyl-[acyl-carrier-protein] synthase II
MRRVAITGLGAITAIGGTAAETFEGSLRARSGVRRAPELAVEAAVPLVASAAFDPKDVRLRQRTAPMDRATAMAVAVARQAVDDAGPGLECGSNRSGVYWGTGMGAASSLESSYEGLFRNNIWRVKPTTVVTAMANAPAAQLSLEFGLRGPTLTYCVACASSAVAIGEAFRAIRDGYIDCAIAGGSEALLTRGTMCAWMALRTLAREDPIDAARSSKPFAADRSGFVLGEGAAAIVLESVESAAQRGAHVYAELAGYGIASDGTHIADPSSEGQARAIAAALDDARIGVGDVGYINAHGTATVVGDRVEAESICQVFGNRVATIPISSTKALHGHAMGATGAIEFIIAVLALASGSIPPTAHLDHPDPNLGLDFVAEGARHHLHLDAVLSNSFAFGGTNAVLVARKVA